MNILALEASTSSAKALLYCGNSIKLMRSKEYKCPNPKTLMQRPQDILEVLFNVGKEVAAGEKIDIISLGSTWHSLILCDKDMNPISEEYSWQYVEASKNATEIREDIDLYNKIYSTTGCLVHAFYPAYKIMKLRELGADIENSILTDLGSYIHYELTSEHLVSKCTASGSALLDINTLGYSDFMLKLCNIAEEQLPTIAEFNKLCPLTSRAAEKLGVISGIPVTLSFSDGGLNQVASCADKKGLMTMSVGTSGALRMTTDMPLIPKTPSSWCYYSPISYLVGVATSGACNCVDWAKNNLFPNGKSYRELEEHPIDRDNLPIFLPFLFSERAPGWNDGARGGFVGLTARHGSIDLFHAVMEGVLYNLRQCYNIVESVAGEPDSILVSGGITKSPIWLQMATDIMQKELLIDPVEQASLMGGIYMAQIINSVTPNYPTHYKKVSPKTKSYELRYEKYLEAYNHQ